jgi:hypothetical protein
MPSATIRNAGFTAQFAPIIKRATATLSDGSVVMMVPDANIAALAGDDATGTPKIAFYKSNAARTTWSLSFTFTPSPQAMSTTQAFVGTMAVGSDDRIGLVWQGTDNSLNFQVFTYSGGTYTASGATQTVAAANSVTRRYRAVDADYAGAADPAIIVYESKASAGPSAWTRVHIRNTDGSTWRKAYEYDHATGAGGNIQIYDGSEDVSISWNAAGIASNVGQLMIYFTRVGFFYDHGDQISEIQYNVSTGTDLSATVLGTWPKFNQDVAAGTRRGWIFKTSSGLWQVALSMGATYPTFKVGRLTHGAYSAPGMDQTTINLLYRSTDFNGVPVRITPMQPQINFSVNKFNAIGCVYADNRVMFGYLTANSSLTGTVGTSYSMSATVFRYPDAVGYSANYVDTQMRALDNSYTYGDQPIGVYGGGNNRNQVGDLKFNFMGLYGYAGNTADTSHKNIVRAIIDTFYDPPTNVAPSLSVDNDAPTLQARVQNTALYPNIRGKIEFTLARDAAFTSDPRTIVEPDANYRYFGSTTSAVPPPVNVSLTLSGVGSQKLYSGTWYMRSRVVSDLGQTSAWSATTTFAVSHAPSALTRGPNSGDLITYGGGGAITFTWNMSDNEPTDVQSAYRILLVRTDTGTTVQDTGKITSSINSATLTISSSLLDVPLQWSVALWDSDNVQGPFSNPVLFTVSQPPTVRMTTPTDGATVTSAAPSTAWSTTFLGSRTQKAYRVSAIFAQLLDLFTRSASSSWGNTTDGKTYTNIGTASEYSVSGTLGVHTHSAVNVKHISLLPALYLDTDQEIEISTAALSTGTGAQRVGLVARYVDSSNYFACDAQFNPDNSIGIRIMSVIGGTETSIATLNPISGLTYTAATRYKIRLKVYGTVLMAKLWLASGQQPGYWHVVAISSLLPNAGQIGAYSRIDTGTTTTLPTTATFDNYTMVDGSSPIVLGTSNWIQGNASSYTFPANVLSNNSYYLIRVDVMDTAGMLGEDSSLVLTQWTAPTDGVSSVTTDDYGATISWTNSGIDVTFISWRVYRRYMVTASTDLDSDNTRNTWVLIYETDAVQSNYSYKDYLAPNNKATDYVVVQVADRFGSVVESPLSSFSTVTITSDRYYFIPTVPVGTIAAYQAGNVTDDSYMDEVESETLHVIGRGRQVQVGDDLGVTGTLTIQLRGSNTRLDREFLQRLASTKNLGTWMKNPFGDVRLVKFGNIQVKPLAGTGTTEMSDLTIPYTEVISDIPVTRL